MRQIFLEKGAIRLKEVSEPSLSKGSVLVEVYYSFISSGTENATISNSSNTLLDSMPEKVKKVIQSISKNGIEGTAALIKGKLKGQFQPLGYSVSGRVIAVGADVKNFRAGDYVACAGAGIANHSDFVCVPENLVVKVSSENFLKSASLTTIGAIALQGIRRANLQLGETVCVIGLGLIGQITVQLAKASGCKVVGVDILDSRLELAEKFGADKTYNSTTCDAEKEIEFWTQHYGADCTIITAASSSSSIIAQAMNITRRRGKVVVVGDVKLDINRDPFYKKEIDLLISCSYGPGRYDSSYEQDGNDYPYAYVRWTENRNMQAFVDLVERGLINIEPLISQEYNISAAFDAYEFIQQKKGIGALLNYRDEQKKLSMGKTQDKILPATLTFMPKSENLRVAMIGAGGFAKIKLLPVISQISHVNINAVVDVDMSNALNISRLYNAKNPLSSTENIYSQDLADVCVIASPHKFHCDQTLEALKSGKAVFVEKPLATDWQQYERISDFLKINNNVPLTVDFNRSFAPFIEKIKTNIIKRNSPLVVIYRMNAGFIPKDHWIQSSVGSGRIIGEACHIFDLFYYLTDSKAVSVSVEAIKSKADDIFSTDNFSAQVSFADGSICTLIYTALGNSAMSKERMEIFFDSKSIVMEDFLTLTGFGLPKSFNQSAFSQDKGHEVLISKFFGALKTKNFEPPISIERLLDTTRLTLIIDQLACQGGGNQEIL